jgi:RNA polymerase sigma-70 factor (ECF subfamily)
MPAYSIGNELVHILRVSRTASRLQTQVAQLFEESREDVFRYLLTLGLDPACAQEGVQEVFLRLYAVMKTGQRIESPRGWVFRVAHNYGLKLRARQATETRFDVQLEARLVARGPNPERQLLERERMERVHRGMDGLSEQQKRCLFLRMEGLRYPEIGAALGISASAVGEFLRRAVARLRKADAGEGER